MTVRTSEEQDVHEKDLVRQRYGLPECDLSEQVQFGRGDDGTDFCWASRLVDLHRADSGRGSLHQADAEREPTRPPRFGPETAMRCGTQGAAITAEGSSRASARRARTGWIPGPRRGNGETTQTKPNLDLRKGGMIARRSDSATSDGSCSNGNVPVVSNQWPCTPCGRGRVLLLQAD